MSDKKESYGLDCPESDSDNEIPIVRPASFTKNITLDKSKKRDNNYFKQYSKKWNIKSGFEKGDK